MTDAFGRAAGNGHRVLEQLYARPIVSVKAVQDLIKASYPAANNLVSQFVSHGVPARDDGPETKSTVPVPGLHRPVRRHTAGGGGVIEDLKPYPETKDSGLAWLGEIPTHWEIKRNGSLFQQRNAIGEPDWPILEVSLRTGVRIREFGSSKRKQVMSDKAKYKCAAIGDYAYNMMRMWQGAAGIAPVDGLVSPAYVVAKPLPHVNPAYFASLFRTDDYLAEIDAFSRGIVKDRNRLYWDQFKQIPTPCPPPEEQKAIIRFLTWATNCLDRTIRAKRRIIALLNEQKQAIIHRAVTRGLDTSVPLKDSGIPWLGEIPEHWEVSAARTLAPRALLQTGPMRRAGIHQPGLATLHPDG